VLFRFHDSISRGILKRMNESHTRRGAFRRVADNLFRYSSSGVYYARYQSNGKDICRSLRTTDRALAKRRLTEKLENASKLDLKVGKMTLGELSYNEYARFLRHLFELALKFRVIAASPAAGLKGLRVETPIRTTSTWEHVIRWEKQRPKTAAVCFGRSWRTMSVLSNLGLVESLDPADSRMNCAGGPAANCILYGKCAWANQPDPRVKRQSLQRTACLYDHCWRLSHTFSSH
jgi:hypothetical protein